ncbi:MAG: hypothetical protein WCF10_21635 [Polyangiales bacterium]
MLPLLYALLTSARSSLKTKRELALENLALRQQLAILKRKTKRPKLTKADRAFEFAMPPLPTPNSGFSSHANDDGNSPSS